MMSNGGVIELDPLPLPIYIKVEGINVQVPTDTPGRALSTLSSYPFML